MSTPIPVLPPNVNHQPAEGYSHDQDDVLDLTKVFYTVQGEGPFAGTPAVFVRLAGCTLTCPKCDTDYTTGRQKTEVGVAADMAFAWWKGNADPQHRWRDKPLCVLTGGEPFRQKIGRFTRLLISKGFVVQIETNGTCFQEDFPFASDSISIVCSPKTPHRHPGLADYIDAYKYILRAGDEDSEDGLPVRSLGMAGRPFRPGKAFRGEIYLQPLDEGDPLRNELNTRAVVRSAMKYGWRVSLQIHKLLGLD